MEQGLKNVNYSLKAFSSGSLSDPKGRTKTNESKNQRPLVILSTFFTAKKRISGLWQSEFLYFRKHYGKKLTS